VNPELAQAYITNLTGDPNTVMDWRVINDRVKGEDGKNLRGTLTEMLPYLQKYNQAGWGVFVCVNAMNDNFSKTLENVSYIRTHVADLDDTFTSNDAYKRAINSSLPPHMVVQTTPNKYHLYWLTEPYTGNDYYANQQRKIVQLYNSDKQVVDATRVLRVPGFYHCKGEPHLVQVWGVHDNPRYHHSQIEQHLSAVNVIERFSTRKPLGDPKLAAPSLEWLTFALNLMDPNELTRDEWMPLTAAFKQAGWSLATEDTLLNIWEQWCARYSISGGNDLHENRKLWRSLRDSEVGWGRFERVSSVKAYYLNDPTKPPVVDQHGRVVRADTLLTPLPPQTPTPEENSSISEVDNLPDILDAYGKQQWFKDCYFIARMGQIFSPSGRFMNSTQFNGLYGGKEFLLKSAGGKVTDEAWKAALRATDWTIPKLDHVRFLPSQGPYAVIIDELGRKGLNTYIPARIKAEQGDVSLWIDFLSRILPTQDDMNILNAYLAHVIKYPGQKIPWAVLIQSERGVGKQLIGKVMKYCVGESYTYEPEAEQLISGASRFNAWMRNKLFIFVDEIRVGDRRDLLEGLKKIITDGRIAVESKGVDQEMEDNVANWLFFSNHKDAIPINENERRYCVFYSQLQSARAIEEGGLTKEYFDRMYDWLENKGGYSAIAHWYMNYPVESGSLPHRAPKTSSYAEVISIGRSPLEILIDSKIEIGERGFRGGFISWPMLLKAVEQSNMRYKPVEYNIRGVLEGRGYHQLGYTSGPVGGEDIMRPSLIYGITKDLNVNDYERMQTL
jgi:hypothetical protein